MLVIQFIKRLRNYFATEQSLNKLSVQQLKDIGLVRADISSIARKSSGF